MVPTLNGAVTPWFPWRTPPVREGWYEVRGFLMDEGLRLYWNGQQFGYWIDEPNRLNWTHMADVATDEWRGLVAPTSKTGQAAR